MSTFNFWKTEITYLKKVGPARAQVLKSEGEIETFGDLLHYFPRRYVDRSKVWRIREIRFDTPHVTLIGKITEFELITQGKGPNRLTAQFTDGSGTVELTWFKGMKWIRDTIKEGQEIVLYGNPKIYGRKITIAHPEIESGKKEEMVNQLKIIPIYPETEKLKKAGLDSRGLRKLVSNLLEAGANDFRENLSPKIVQENRLMSRKEALRQIHFPDSFDQLEKAQRRLKFEEFFFFQLLLAQRKLIDQPRHLSFPFPRVGDYFNQFYQKHLPFELTGAQKRVIKEARKDLAGNIQMNRLIQGDVGAGKTMVAFMIMLIALDNGFQAALMAPTEILAEQHFRKMTAHGKKLGLKVAMLSGSVKKSARKQLFIELKEGLIDILVGTHALIEDTVVFKKLGLVIVDEQHKFGVKQRSRLIKKQGNYYPHNLLMTATPIPRTLALTLYGDVDVSVIDEMPPGRVPVKTAVRSESQRLEVFGFMRKEIKAGRQVYIVYPLVEESEKLDYLAVTEGYESVSRAFPMPEYQIGIVHGRMKPEDKEKGMQSFKKGETQILVATTVIEVGVDAPNATMIVIENSEKFGLSQLHQLRGRVGRSSQQSYCILMVGNKTSETAKKRLKAMVATHDGFKISEYDLKLRGPGDFLGTRQSGLPEFRLANITEDGPILLEARQAAFDLVNSDKEMQLPENQAIKVYFAHYRVEQTLFATGG